MSNIKDSRTKQESNPNNFRTYKCVHRHFPSTCSCAGYYCSHINCWNKERYAGEKVGYLDIECSNLHADFGFIISWCLKERDKDEMYFDIINKKDVDNATRKHEPIIDKRVVVSCIRTILENKFDRIVCHYGVINRGLDIPFLRTRAVKYDIYFPVWKQIYGFDTYPTVRNKFKIHSNRLDAWAKFLNCPIQKTELDGNAWNMATYADEKALKYILEHNKNDVLILEWVHKRIEKYANVSRSSI